MNQEGSPSFVVEAGQIQILIIALAIGLLALGGYFVYQNMNKPVPVQPQKEIISNIKIGKYETLYKGGWEELNYIDTANSKNPDELYEVFSKAYPDLTDNNSEFFIQKIIIKDDTAEVYFGGDEGAITDRMGTTGPYNYSGLVTFALTEDEKIKKVDFKLKTEGSHFGPRISTRDDFIYLWPTQLLEEIASNSKHARIALASRKRLSDETSDWKTYTNKGGKYLIKYAPAYTIHENGVVSADGIIAPASNTLQIISTVITEINTNFTLSINYYKKNNIANLSPIEIALKDTSCTSVSTNQGQPTILGGNQAFIFPDTLCGLFGSTTYIHSIYRGYIYTLVIESRTKSYEDLKPYVEKILSTFKFLP